MRMFMRVPTHFPEANENKDSLVFAVPAKYNLYPDELTKLLSQWH